jgi:hypothetical protein
MFTLALVAVVSFSTVPAGQEQRPAQPDAAVAVNKDALVQKELLDGVGKYVELRKRLEGQLPALSDEATPEAIASHQKALLKSLQRARRDAKPGELFTPSARAMIRRLLARSAAQPGTPSRAAIREENPGAINIAVNGEYPTSAPLPTVPPQALLALPRLPDEQLEFRFLGTRLILLDARANMVVDYMERALL